MLIGLSPTLKGDTPESGLYLTSLPWININAAEAALTREQESAASLLQGELDFATKKIKEQLTRAHFKNWLLPSVINEGTIGTTQEDKRIINSEANLRGIRIQIDEGSYLKFRLNKISIFWESAVSGTLQVFDLIQNKLLDTINFDSIAGQRVDIATTKKYESNRQKLHLLFVVDGSLSNAFETLEDENGHCYGCTNNRHYNNIRIDGARIDPVDPKTDNNVRLVNETHGLSIDYTLECSLESLVNSMIDQFAWPILYKASSGILEILASSTNINSLVSYHSNTIEEDIIKSNAGFDEAMALSLQSITNITDGLCVTQWKAFPTVSGLQ